MGRTDVKAGNIWLLLLLASPLAFADNATTEGGNISRVELTLPQNSSWFGVCGQTTGAAFGGLAINGTPGNISCLSIDTGNSSCGNGTAILNLLFSNSSSAMNSLSAGSLAVLDSFINSANESGSLTFTTNSTFATNLSGNITSVPTTYTEPSGPQTFRLGYLQDQSGNLVFITPVVDDQAGFNSSLFDYQAILPMKSGAPTTYSVSIDLQCSNGSTTTPPDGGGGGGSSGGGGSYNYQGSQIPYYPEPPEVEIPTAPPTAADIRVLQFSPYREVLPGDNIVIAPLVENPTGEVTSISIEILGPEGSLASPVKNILLSPGEKQTIPLSLKIPADMPGGYYSIVMKLSTANDYVSYPTILRVVSIYRVGQPAVKRQFSLDYEKHQTLVSLTVTNRGSEPISHLQVYEKVPSEFFDEKGNRRFTTELSSINGEGDPTVEGQNIRWDVQDIRPYESRTIYYQMPALLTDISDFRSWNLAQITVIDSASRTDILVRDLQVPTMLPGERGEIFLRLFNAGGVTHDVDLDIIGPTGWKVSPKSLSFIMPPRDLEDVIFNVESPAFSEPGTYGFTLRIKYRDTFYDRQVFVYVNKPVVEFYAPPLSDQVMAFMGGNALSIAALILVASLSVAVATAVYRKINSPQYSQERLDDLQALGRMMEQNDRKK